MTSDCFLYFENSFYRYDNGEKNQVRDRLIPMSKIKRIWNWDRYFCIATDGYSDLYMEKASPDETMLDFYKRIYVPIPSQVVIDSNT